MAHGRECRNDFFNGRFKVVIRHPTGNEGMGKVYTRGGDEGFAATLLWGRRRKSDDVFEVVGVLDELNSFLGWAAALSSEEILRPIQNDLFEIGFAVMSAQPFDAEGARVAWLESQIDRIDADNPPLTRFILPGGNPPAAATHCARAICRRAERVLVAFEASASIIRYLNRLSDLLFVLGRRLNNGVEVYWQRSGGQSAQTGSAT